MYFTFCLNPYCDVPNITYCYFRYILLRSIFYYYQQIYFCRVAYDVPLLLCKYSESVIFISNFLNSCFVISIHCNNHGFIRNLINVNLFTVFNIIILILKHRTLCFISISYHFYIRSRIKVQFCFHLFSRQWNSRCIHSTNNVVV